MKTLLLMRHAKATWDHDQWPDFERPLNPTGEADAPRMGRRMIQADLKPDAILCSSARRTMQTAELVAEELGITPLIQSKADLYQRLSPELNCVLCVGHNNGLEDLVSHLLRKRKSFSTAGLARVELNDWAGFDRSIQPSHIEVWEPE